MIKDRNAGYAASVPNQLLQPTSMPPLRSGMAAAERGRWIALQRV